MQLLTVPHIFGSLHLTLPVAKSVLPAPHSPHNKPENDRAHYSNHGIIHKHLAHAELVGGDSAGKAADDTGCTERQQAVERLSARFQLLGHILINIIRHRHCQHDKDQTVQRLHRKRQ